MDYTGDDGFPTKNLMLKILGKDMDSEEINTIEGFIEAVMEKQSELKKESFAPSTSPAGSKASSLRSFLGLGGEGRKQKYLFSS